MEDILKDLSPESVIPAIENNIYDFFITISKKANRVAHTNEAIKWVITRPSVWPNYLFDEQFEKSNIEEQIIYIKNQIKTKKAPSQWFIGPRSNSPNLANILNKHSFTKIGQWPGMAVRLSEMNKNFPKPLNLTIKIIDDNKTLIQWVEVVSLAMFGGGFIGIDLFKNLISEQNVRFYLALLNQKPVATSMLFISSGIAGLYLISTLPEYRNQGIGTIVTLAPLIDAQKIGYCIGGLFATYLGERVYRKIGFKKYCNFDIYIY